MKNLLSGLIGGLIGAFVGATISGFIAYNIFQKQLLINQYALFAEDIERAYAYGMMWKSHEIDDFRKETLKTETELSLNKAWTRALAILPDEVFSEIDRMVTRGTIDPKTRNRIYYLLRQQLYPNTSIQYDDIMGRKISVKD